MGEVGAVRSLSLSHAVAACMRPGDHPAILLVKPASPFVAAGSGPAAPGEDRRRERGIPWLRTGFAGPAELHDENRLLVQAVLPADGAAAGLWPEPAERPAHLARVPVQACRQLGLEAEFRPPHDVVAGGRPVGGVRSGSVAGATLGLGWLVIVRDEELEATALARPQGTAPASDLRRELGALPPLASVAEALVGACEAAWQLELVPSMPTPAEMEQVYEWDRRLAAAGGEVPEPAPAAERGAV